MLEAVIAVFNWSALIISALLVSLTLVVANQFSIGQKTHNAIISLVSAILYSVLLTNWDGFAKEWQAISLQFILTILFACIVGFTRYMDVVDSFISKSLDKAGVGKKDNEVKP